MRNSDAESCGFPETPLLCGSSFLPRKKKIKKTNIATFSLTTLTFFSLGILSLHLAILFLFPPQNCNFLSQNFGFLWILNFEFFFISQFWFVFLRIAILYLAVANYKFVIASLQFAILTFFFEFWVYILEFCYFFRSQEIKDKKGNCDFLSHNSVYSFFHNSKFNSRNSNFFLRILSLHLAILTILLGILNLSYNSSFFSTTE